MAPTAPTTDSGSTAQGSGHEDIITPASVTRPGHDPEIGAQIEGTNAVGLNQEALRQFPPPAATYNPTFVHVTSATVAPTPVHPNEWKRLIPEGMTPEEYHKIEPPASPPPTKREGLDPAKLLLQLSEYDEDSGIDRDDFRSWPHFFSRALLMERDMLKDRKHLREPRVVKARYELGLAHMPPRPKLPVNEAFRNWFGPVFRKESDSTPTNYIPKQEFATEADWWDAMEKFYGDAQWWIILRKNEKLLVSLAITAQHHTEHAAWVREMTANRENIARLLDDILPVRIRPDILAADPAAPKKLRGFRWWSYTTIPAPPGYPQHDRIFIWTNVDYVPQLPETGFPQIFEDGRYGRKEWSRFPGPHIPGGWHWAFIPTERKGLIAENREHNSLHRSLEFYRIELPRDFVTRDGVTWSPTPALRHAMQKYWDSVMQQQDSLDVPRALLSVRPFAAEQVGRQALRFLFDNELRERDLKETMASWQRSVAELRGWKNYIASRAWLETYVHRTRRMMPMMADLRIHDFRKDTRGVFTDDVNVAGLYAQFGVPVWFVHAGTERFWTAAGEADRVEMSDPFQCVTRMYAGSDPSYRPSHLVPLQEYPVGGAAGTGATDDHDDGGGGGGDYYDIMAQDDDYAQPQGGAPPPAAPIGSTSTFPRVPVPSSSIDGQHQGNIPPPANSSTPSTSTVPPDSAASDGAKKRKGDHDEPVKQLKKKKSHADALGLPKYPPERIVKNYPIWWPKHWPVALEAVLGVPMRDPARVRALQIDRKHPVPNGASKAGAFASPVLDQFAGEMQQGARPGNTSRMFRSYVAVRHAIVYGLGTQLACDVQRWSPKEWKDILTWHVNQPKQAECLQRLGLARQPEPPVVDLAQLPVEIDVDRLAASLKQFDLLSPLPATSTSASPAPYFGLDDYGEQIMVPLHPQPEEPRYFVPLDVDVSPRLGRHDERYLAEPSAWRFTGPGKQRAQKTFAFWLERASDTRSADDTLEFVFAGTKLRKDSIDGDSDLWWDYNRGRVFIFSNEPSGEGSLLGERLTKPLRLFEVDGGGRPKFVGGTDTSPVQLRLWRAQPWNKCVDVPQVPLGAVGSRASLRWDLDDASYKIMFPTAPRLPPPEELARIKAGYDDASEKHGLVSANVRSSAPREPAAPAASQPVATPTTSTPAPQSTSAIEDASSRPGLAKPLNDALNPYGQIVFKGQVLPPYEPPKDDRGYVWPDARSRALIVWDVAELAFRLELCLFDDMLRLMYRKDTKLNGQSTIERMQMICDIWESDSFVPHVESPLTSQEWTQRIKPVVAFHKLVSTWPRTREILADRPEKDEFKSKDLFLDFEKKVWLAYARTHADYEFREAAVPLMYPVFDDDAMDLS